MRSRGRPKRGIVEFRQHRPLLDIPVLPRFGGCQLLLALLLARPSQESVAGYAQHDGNERHDDEQGAKAEPPFQVWHESGYDS